MQLFYYINIKKVARQSRRVSPRGRWVFSVLSPKRSMIKNKEEIECRVIDFM